MSKEPERAYLSDEFSQMGKEIIDGHADLQFIREYGLTVGFLTSNKVKKHDGMAVFADCRKVSEYYKQEFVPFDFLITVYQDTCEIAHFTEKEYRILLYHELLHVGARQNEKTGEVSMFVRPHDVQEFRTIIDQFGIDWPTRGVRPSDSVHAGKFVDELYDEGEDEDEAEDSVENDQI